MILSRRTFLRTSVAAATAVGFPAIATAAAPWAKLPASVGDLPKYKILEIHLPGGASMWESLWISHDGPASGGGGLWLATETPGGPLNWRGLGEYVASLQWHPCANGPASSVDTREFGIDDNGTPVSWGPATAPLWRPDIFDRCRMLVTQHGDGLHAFAAYRTMTGRRFGSPRGASLGAAIQRHFQSVEQQDIPYAYAFGPANGGGRDYFLKYPALIGQHPGPSRPLVLRVGTPIGDLLKRDAISDSADALFDELRGQYRDLLRWPDNGNVVRAPDFESYDAAAHYLVNADSLDAHLGGDELEAGSDSPCVNDPAHSFGDVQNTTRRSLQLAAHMLSNGARHVTVVDGGLPESLLLNGSMPYDAHNNEPGKFRNVVESTSAHLFNLFQSLAAIIEAPSTGTGGLLAASSGPTIDLSDTLVVVNTEFNRTPNPGTGTNAEGYAYAGREHFSAGNVALLIGGPVPGRGIHGGFALADGDHESAIATQALTPTDVHMGVLLAGGVNPVDPDNFTVGDDISAVINPGGNAYADEIRTKLKEHVLGITSQLDSLTLG